MVRLLCAVLRRLRMGSHLFQPRSPALVRGRDAHRFAVLGDRATRHRNALGREQFRDAPVARSEEHTSELQSRSDLVCRLLLEKKKKKNKQILEARYTLADAQIIRY